MYCASIDGEDLQNWNMSHKYYMEKDRLDIHSGQESFKLDWLKLNNINQIYQLNNSINQIYEM